MRRWAAAGLDIVHRTSAARRPPGHGPPERLRRHPPGQPLHRVPPHGRVRADRPDGSVRRPHRDLERGALVLARLVPPAPAPDRPPPRPRPDVGPDHAPPAGRGRPAAGGPGRSALLPRHRGRHAVRGDAGRAAGAGLPPRPRDRGRQRRRRTFFSPAGPKHPTPLVVAAGRHGARQALHAAARGGGAGPPAGARAPAAPDRRGAPAAGAGGVDPATTAPQAGCTCWATSSATSSGRVPEGVGRGQRLAGRGLGPDPDRSRRAAAPRRWRRTSAAIAARSSTAAPASWRRPDGARRRARLRPARRRPAGPHGWRRPGPRAHPDVGCLRAGRPAGLLPRRAESRLQ